MFYQTTAAMVSEASPAQHETPKAEWAAGGVESLPIEAPELKLSKG